MQADNATECFVYTSATQRKTNKKNGKIENFQPN